MTYNEHTDWDCSLQAAKKILPPLIAAEDIMFVVDFGCGLGAWLQVAGVYGVTRGVGLDAEAGALARGHRPTDLTKPVDLGERFDLAICLEVGEHLPASAADTLVDTICRHADLALFSAATPGQGGDGHINEQPHAYWDDRFTARGYEMEPVDTTGVEAHWYRNNIRLFRCSR